jgi:hypothetical protein
MFIDGSDWRHPSLIRQSLGFIFNSAVPNVLAQIGMRINYGRTRCCSSHCRLIA